MTYYQTTHLEDYIKKLLLRIGVSTPFQLDLFNIAGRLGVDLTFSEQPTHYQGSTIKLNINLTKPELWEKFSHEVCHVLRHSGNQLFLPLEFTNLQESQASNFALHFCIPTFMLKKLDLPFSKKEAIRNVAEIFNVTIAFAAERLRRYENQWIHSLMSNSNNFLYPN